MKHCIVQVVKTHENGMIDCIWVQNHVGNLESATEVAFDTEKVNTHLLEDGSKMEFAVVEDLSICCPDYNIRHDKQRLDLSRLKTNGDDKNIKTENLK